ncbi:hypothetical protein GDO81_023809 [Engystomops pustulosus]|uniref:Uncharacterized protein n=1 Tax=Engystomops pustulosus TaxID=76066 RepID=A0AAV6YMB9_ENGPU|nr:hypothetical protein GDO81_023809 [Engystomops pustulosus]
MPRAEQKLFQNLEVNCTPRSETTLSGIPCSLNISRIIRSAVCSAVGIPLAGMKWAIFVRRSTTTRMVVIPLEGGRSTTKSIEIDPQGREGTGSGCSNPNGEERGVLF